MYSRREGATQILGGKCQPASHSKIPEHRDAIEKLVSQLEPLLAGFETGTAPYAKLKEHAKKFHDAQMKDGNSKGCSSFGTTGRKSHGTARRLGLRRNGEGPTAWGMVPLA